MSLPWETVAIGLIVPVQVLFGVYPFLKDAIRTPRVPPDGWRLDEIGTRWHLRWRPPPTDLLRIPSLYRIVSSPEIRAAVQFVFVLAASACIWRSVTRCFDVFESSVACIALDWVDGVSLLGFVWCLVDYGLNRERDGSDPHSGSVAGNEANQLIIGGPLFPMSCLASLKLSETGAKRGRKTICFVLRDQREIVLVGAPGVSEQAAIAIRDALLARLATVASQQAEAERTKQSSGLAMESGGEDNRLVASR